MEKVFQGSGQLPENLHLPLATQISCLATPWGTADLLFIPTERVSPQWPISKTGLEFKIIQRSSPKACATHAQSFHLGIFGVRCNLTSRLVLNYKIDSILLHSSSKLHTGVFVVIIARVPMGRLASIQLYSNLCFYSHQQWLKGILNSSVASWTMHPIKNPKSFKYSRSYHNRKHCNFSEFFWKLSSMVVLFKLLHTI